MTKHLKLIISILVAVIILGTAGYIIVNKNITKKQNEKLQQIDTSVQLFSFETANLSDLNISFDDESYTFSYADLVWSSDDVDFRINTSALNNLVNVFKSLTADNTVEKNAADLSVYGLDKPTTITLTFTDSTKCELKIGSLNATNEGYYAMANNDSNVYLLSTDDGSVLKLDRNGLKNNYLFDSALDAVTGYSLERDEKTIYNLKKDAESVWSMSEPLPTASINQANISATIDLIIRVLCISFVEENITEDKYSEYGFDNPSYVLSVADDKASETIIFGNMLSGSTEIYALYKDEGQVVTFDTADLGFLDYQTEFYLDEKVHAEDMYDVSSVSLLFDGVTYNMTISAIEGEIDKAQYTFNGTDIDALGDDAISLFTDLYSAMVGTYIDTYDNSYETNGEPEVEIVYTRKSDPKTVTVSYIPISDNQYAACIDGEFTGLIVRKKAFYDDEKGISKTLNALLDYIG